MSPVTYTLLALLAVSLPARAEDACYPRLREAFDKAINVVGQDCNAIKADVASDCQRSILTRCQKSHEELKRMQGELCQKFVFSGKIIKGSVHADSVDSQNTAQIANTSLNQDNAYVSDSVAAKLSAESTRITQLMRENEAAIRAHHCVKSANYPTYSNRMKTLSDSLTIVRDGLDSLARRKKADSAQATAVATASTTRSENLASQNSMIAPSTVDDDGKKRPKWLVPVLAGAAGLAALYAILKMKDGGLPGLPVDFGDESGSGGSIGSQKATPFEGDPKQFTESSGVKIDDSFSDADKRQIAAAVNMIPECNRKYLVGLFFENKKNLVWSSSKNRGKCLSGKQASTNPPIIWLNPTCHGTVSAALAVHEMMHLLAHRRGMYDGYRDTFERHGQCAVSPYSASYGGFNMQEDFAEAGRIAVFPGSGMASASTCATNKVRRAKELINACK